MGIREPAPAGANSIAADANKPFMSFGSNTEGAFPTNDEILAGHGVTLASIPIVPASTISPWHHFIYTVTPQSSKQWRQIYMDGALIADALSDLALNIQTTTYRIAQGGKGSGPATNGWWDGDIDEVRSLRKHTPPACASPAASTDSLPPCVCATCCVRRCTFGPKC